MDDEARRAAGDARRREVLGNAYVDATRAKTSDLTADLQDLITRYAWGEIWNRPGLDVRTRRVLVLGTLIALGRWEEVRLHAAAALSEGGFSIDDLKEIALQQAVYCGVPAARTAFEMLQALVNERR
jgi:4-carboxymuconolactone decarboxylase